MLVHPTSASDSQIAGMSSMRSQCSWKFCRLVMSMLLRAYLSEMSEMRRTMSDVRRPFGVRTRIMKNGISSPRVPRPSPWV